MKINISSEYTIADQIVAELRHDEREIGKVVISEDNLAEIMIDDAEINQLPACRLQLLARVLAALSDATDDETDIPFCVDTSFEL